MWYKPGKGLENNNNEGLSIKVLKTNLLFQLQKCKKQITPISLISHLSSKSQTQNSSSYLHFPFRIILTGNENFVVAGKIFIF